MDAAGVRAARQLGRFHPEPDAVRRAPRGVRPATSRTARTPSSASTICATTWPSPSTASSSAATRTRSWTRSTRSSSTRRVRRSSSRASRRPPPRRTTSSLAWRRTSTAQPATRKTAKGLDETELSGADFLYDEKFKTVSPAQTTIEKVERALGIDNLYDPRNVILVNHLMQALKAQSLYKRDVDYVVQEGEVKIVDEFTGRIMEGRRWSEGLHQAIEAKEGVRIREENVTLASITLQNYFRLYEKLAGMTGTAKTEEKEFVEIYDLHVVEIPTNQPVARARRERLHLQDARGEVRRRARRHRRAPRGGPARARRHDRGRDLRVPLRAAQAQGHPAQRPEREGARARGRDHQGRGAARRGHDRDEHGRPRRRHQARRGRRRDGRALRPRDGAARVAPHRQPAPRPLGPPGRPRRDALLPLGPGRPRAPVRRRPDLQHHEPLQDPGRPGHGGVDPLEADRERPEEGRGAELRRAQERPQVRRRHEHAAHGHLRAAPPRSRGRGPLRRGARVDPRGRRDGRHAARRTPSTRRNGISTGS